MKCNLLLFAVVTLIPAIQLADTLQIGTFTLPFRFEDNNMSDIVRHVVTNDVQSFCAPITSFMEPYQDDDGNICVQRINTPDTTLYLPATLKNGITFYIENGQTNCIIKRSLTDTAKALESELSSRTNLVNAANLLIESIMDGTVTNRSITELRMLSRVYKGGVLSVVTECSDDVIRQNFIYMREHLSFFRPCILDSAYKRSGTNSYFFVWAGYDTPNEPSYRRSIAAFPFVYADGYWSLCFE